MLSWVVALSFVWSLNVYAGELIGSGTEPSVDTGFKVDLYAYWDLDAAINPLNDLHNSNNLTNNGADDVTGGYQFIAANSDYMTAPMATFDEAGAITLFMRFKVETTPANSRLAHFRYADTGIMLTYSAGSVYAHPGDSSGTTWGPTSGAELEAVADDTIINYIVVVSTGTVKTITRVYINGVEEGTPNFSAFNSGINLQQLIFGRRNDVANYSNMLLEKAIIWEKAFTAQECIDINTDYKYTDW